MFLYSYVSLTLCSVLLPNFNSDSFPFMIAFCGYKHLDHIRFFHFKFDSYVHFYFLLFRLIKLNTWADFGMRCETYRNSQKWEENHIEQMKAELKLRRTCLQNKNVICSMVENDFVCEAAENEMIGNNRLKLAVSIRYSKNWNVNFAEFKSIDSKIPISRNGLFWLRCSFKRNRKWMNNISIFYRSSYLDIFVIQYESLNQKKAYIKLTILLEYFFLSLHAAKKINEIE